MRLLRVYHAGRDPGHRARERALAAAGVKLTLVVPTSWPDAGSQAERTAEDFHIVELRVQRSGDVNRHRYADPAALAAVVEQMQPDLVDVHEEPFSIACRQWLRAAGGRPSVAYTAQNVDKRFPPPFAQYEQRAFRQLSGLYPCSRQAAAVARGKGFSGLIEVLPLGVDAARQAPGQQDAGDDSVVLGLIGRLVPEKGVRDAVRVLHELRRSRAAELLVVGTGPEQQPAQELADALGVAEHVTFTPWQSPETLAELYRTMHVVLVPSSATETWVEQFGRVIVEGQAAGAVVAGYASGAIPEVAGEAGVLVPEHDVAALAREVVAVLAEPGDFRRRRDIGLVAAAVTTWDAVAERQVAFYEQALSTPRRQDTGRSPSEQRALAQQEFGPPATLAGGVRRPFALPVLRRDTPLSRGLGSVIDRFNGD